MSAMSGAAVTTQEDNTANGLFLLFGLALGFTAEFWVGMASIQIKYSHKLDATSTMPRPAYCRGRWWFGFSLLILNITFNFASYMFASLNILAPTSALVIVINAILARAYFGERLTCFGYLGSLFIMIGCVLSILFGTHKQDELKIDNLFIKADNYKFVLFTTIHGSLCIIFGIIGSTKLRQKTILKTTTINREDMILKEDIKNPSEIEFINNNTPHIAASDDDDDGDCKEERDKNIDLPPNAEEMNNINDDEYDDKPLIEDSKMDNNMDHIRSSSASITSDETSPIVPKTAEQIAAIEREEWKHMIRCILLAFSTSGLVSWVQFLGKIAADLFFETIWNGNNQFTTIQPWFVVIILICMLLGELYLMSEIMRIFDAILIIPIYNSLQILSTIALSAVYWDNFRDWSIRDSLLFTLGLMLIFSGIGSISHGQKHQSMAHHEKDKRQYSIITKHGGHTRNIKMPSINDHSINQMVPDQLP